MKVSFEPKNPPKPMRSFRLTPEMNEKLDFVCESFGVNANSYLVSEIGKAVVRDCLILNVQNNTDKTMETLSAMLAAVVEQGEKIDEVSSSSSSSKP